MSMYQSGYVCVSVSVGICEGVSVSVGICEGVSVSVGICECQCISGDM